MVGGGRAGGRGGREGRGGDRSEAEVHQRGGDRIMILVVLPRATG